MVNVLPIPDTGSHWLGSPVFQEKNRVRNSTSLHFSGMIAMLLLVSPLRFCLTSRLTNFLIPFSRTAKTRARRSFYVSNVAICWSSHVEALQAPMRSEQGASAKSGCFDCRCSPPPSYGMKPRFQNH